MRVSQAEATISWAAPTGRGLPNGQSDEEQLENWRSTLLAASESAISFGTDTVALMAKVVFGLLIMMVALFFLLAEGARMLEGPDSDAASNVLRQFSSCSSFGLAHSVSHDR